MTLWKIPSRTVECVKSRVYVGPVLIPAPCLCCALLIRASLAILFHYSRSLALQSPSCTAQSLSSSLSVSQPQPPLLFPHFFQLAFLACLPFLIHLSQPPTYIYATVWVCKVCEALKFRLCSVLLWRFPCYPSLACRDETEVFDVVMGWPNVGSNSADST